MVMSHGGPGNVGGGLRRRRRGRKGAINEINMTPFIDVMLVLLIVFMVSAPAADGRRAARSAGEPRIRAQRREPSRSRCRSGRMAGSILDEDEIADGEIVGGSRKRRRPAPRSASMFAATGMWNTGAWRRSWGSSPMAASGAWRW
jgi:hypothetical protein